MMNSVAASLRYHGRRPAVIGAVLIGLITGTAWAFRVELSEAIRLFPALLPAGAVGLGVILLSLSASLVFEQTLLQKAWLRRTRMWTGLARVTRRTQLGVWITTIGDPLEWLVQPLVKSGPGSRMAEQWISSGLGTKPSRYLLIVAAFTVLGWWIGSRLSGTLLGAAFAVLAPFAPLRFVNGRAAAQQGLVRQQLPAALDALGGGLAAGLSFDQAIAFAARELPEPIAASFRRLHRRLDLGSPVEAALLDLVDHEDDETLELVVEGILLQRQFGGNLVRILEKTAVLLRERAELEREVRAITTQGRLSGWVIAGLVPVSAALLLLTNPRYIDVLFETLIGQALLIAALLLQLIGWFVISRLVRFRY